MDRFLFRPVLSFLVACMLLCMCIVRLQDMLGASYLACEADAAATMGAAVLVRKNLTERVCARSALPHPA